MPDPILLQRLRAMAAQAGARAAADATTVSRTPRADPLIGLPMRAASTVYQAGKGMAAEVQRDPVRAFMRAINPVQDVKESAGDIAQAWRSGDRLGAGMIGAMAAAPFVTGQAGKAFAREMAPEVRAAVEAVEASRAAPANPYAHLPEPPRMYHGTSAAFEQFDPTKLDPGGLYGPGYYHTDAPAVAGGEVGERTVRHGPFADESAAQAEIVKRREWDAQFGDDGRQYVLAQSPYGHEVEERAVGFSAPGYASKGSGSHPNVRPARVAVGNPFDVDAHHSADDVRRLFRTFAERDLAPYLGTEPAALDAWAARSTQDAMGRASTLNGEDLYRRLTSWGGAGDMAKTNATLKAAGYDGITHTGGANTGTAPHKVTIAFDRSQIRSPWGDWKNAAQFGAILAALGLGGAATQQQPQPPQ